jgi:NAD(P)-dependent dehydrogenase (short-subunit alcohol dehydrogenase family)
LIDVLPPGLYEAIFEPKGEDTINADLASGDWVMRCEERTLDDIRALGGNDPADERCFAAAATIMRKAQWGRIINMSSGAVTLGRPNYLHYVTSKSALVGMTNSLARELGGHGITVNAIMPGPVFTEIPRATVTPEQKERLVAAQCIQRPQKPDDLFGTVLFLASDASAFLTGQSITVDGGCTHP